jgi:hypothetical protein
MFGIPSKVYACKHLLSKYVADKLLEQYWVAVHPIARTVHQSSLEQRYRKLWYDVAEGSTSIASIEAVIFAILFAGAVSVSDEALIQELGISRQVLIESLQRGTELALQRAQISSTTKTETFQGFITYLVYCHYQYKSLIALLTVIDHTVLI